MTSKDVLMSWIKESCEKQGLPIYVEDNPALYSIITILKSIDEE